MGDKERYKKLKSLGICTQCKKRKALKNRVRCGSCLYDDQAYRRAKKEIASGKNPVDTL
jgi:hypothetical protein